MKSPTSFASFQLSTFGLTISLILSMLVAIGCNQVNEPEQLETTTNEMPLEDLNVLIIGDANLGDTISRQWRSRMDGVLNTQSLTVKEFIANDYQLPSELDVVIYPPEFLGELVIRKQISEIPANTWSDPEFNKKEILTHSRITNVTYGRLVYAVPLGSPQFTMMYRKDVLTKLDVDPPTNWIEFDSLAAKLRQVQTLSNDAGPLPTEICFPLGGDENDHWAAKSFLARVAPYIRHRGKLTTVFDKENMRPLIATEPFVRALTEMADSLGNRLAQSELYSPQEIYERILSGQTAVGITWPTEVKLVAASDDEDDSVTKSATATIGLLPMPGSDEWFDQKKGEWTNRSSEDLTRVDLVGFDGFIASVPIKSSHTRTAFKFLTWLPGKQISLATMPQSPRSGPFRASHLGNPAVWTGKGISGDTAKKYGDAIRETNNQKIVFVFPRIPGQAKYLATLNAAVIDCLSNGLDPKTALERVDTEWSAINEQMGPSKQLGELRRSENY